MPIRFHLKASCLALLCTLALAATSAAQNRPPISEEIAKAYGLDSFSQIEKIRYTFNIEFPGFKLSRSWIWEPKTGRVSYDGKDKAGNPVKVTYLRSQLSTQDAVVKDEVDPAFNNDQYWLTFPFHQFQDGSPKVEDAGMQKLPLGKGSAQKVIVTYPSEAGGYTPGDTWTLFVGADKLVKEFIYHRGGAMKPTLLTTTWTDYKKAGPLVVAMDHRGTGDGKPARIFFSDVAVVLTGSDAWVNAK